MLVVFLNSLITCEKGRQPIQAAAPFHGNSLIENACDAEGVRLATAIVAAAAAAVIAAAAETVTAAAEQDNQDKYPPATAATETAETTTVIVTTHNEFPPKKYFHPIVCDGAKGGS